MFQKGSIGFESARKAVDAVIRALRADDQVVAIAVADETGELVHALRMDGASANDMRQASRKAYTAAFMARDSKGYRAQLLEDGRRLADWSDPMLTTLTGGVIIRHNGQVIGGVGVHGNSPERDEELARIGVEAMGLNGAAPEGRRADAIAQVESTGRAAGGERSTSMSTATRRKTVNLPGLSAGSLNDGGVAPDLVQVGNLFFTSAVRGVDLKTGRLGETPEEQFTFAWRNLRALVEHAGISPDHIGLVTNFIDSQDHRAHINPGWLELFPDENNRPARKTTSYPLPKGAAVELQAYGVVGQRRQRIEVEGLAHRDPLPNGVRLGDYVFSSVIVPQDLATAKTVEGPEAQTDQCFDNMRVFMEKAGGSVSDVVLQWVYLSDFAHQPYMVDVYLKAWPVGGYQAARKTFRYPMNGQIQIQVIGRIGGPKSNHEIPGHEHHDPIPMGARIGDLYASSGVSGVDVNGPNKLEPVEGAANQSHHGLANIKSLVETGAGSLADIGHMTFLVSDYADVPQLDAAWKRTFPDPADRPARQIMQLGAQGRSRVQCHMLAVVG
jgi:enamine deaminase RidA (YjgF/YER057c/UK114 family)/uncharacterized protein GlcG (DUF336 family)